MADYSRYSIEELKQMRASLSVSPESVAAVRAKQSGGEGNWLTRNLDVPASIAGSLGGAAAGAAAGSVVPVVGTAVGGILGAIAGGATGAGLGSLASDVALERKVDWEEAADKAAESAMYDTLFLGAGKVLRPAFKALGAPAQDLFRTAGVSFFNRKLPNLADDLLDMDAIELGSIEARRLAEDYLVKATQGKGGLSAVQTGQAKMIRSAAEQLGDTGLISKGRSVARIEANDEALHQLAKDEADYGFSKADLTSSAMGKQLYGIIEGGRKIASKAYEEGVDEITAKHGTKQVSAIPIKKALTAFIKENEHKLGSEAGAASLSMIKKLLNDVTEKAPAVADPRAGMKVLRGAAGQGAVKPAGDMMDTLLANTVKTTDVDSLIKFQRGLNVLIEEGLPNSALDSPQTFRQLTRLSKRVKNGIQETLKEFSPETAATFAALNKTFGYTANNLLPDINKNVIKKGDKGAYKNIGKLLKKPNDTDKVRAMMKSVDQAYAASRAAGIPLEGDAIKSAKRAKQLIRQGYATEIFKDALEGNNFEKFKKNVDGLFDEESLEKARAIMGEDFSSYKKALLIMSAARGGGDKKLFELAMKQRELTALSQAVGAPTQVIGGTAAAAFNPLAAAAIFTIPSVMATIATNRSAVNRLLSVSKQVEKSGGDLTAPLVVTNMMKVLSALSDEEQESIRDDMFEYYR